MPSIRNKYRELFGIKPTDIIFLYSGSAEVWQCVDETIILMNKIAKERDNAFFIILSNDYCYFKDKMRKFADKLLFCDAVPFEKVPEFLNASDIGIILRNDIEINRCASPVKYAEYSMTGLKIIVTSAVDQINQVGKKLDNIINYDFDRIPAIVPFDEQQRIDVAIRASEIFDRKNYLDFYKKFYFSTIQNLI